MSMRFGSCASVNKTLPKKPVGANTTQQSGNKMKFNVFKHFLYEQIQCMEHCFRFVLLLTYTMKQVSESDIIVHIDKFQFEMFKQIAVGALH